MLQRQAGGADRLAGDGERGDLDDLAVTTGVGASVLLRSGDVFPGGYGVAGVGGKHGKQGVLDCAHVGVHSTTIRDPADPALIPR